MLRFIWQDGKLDFGAALKPTARVSSRTKNFVGGSISPEGRVDISIAKGVHPNAQELSYLIWRELDNGRNQDYVEDVENLVNSIDISRFAADVEDTEPANNFGFMKDPHKELYPPAFRGGDKIPKDVARVLKDHVLDVIKSEYNNPDEWIYFTVYGSGISYNWDEEGDFDIQMWVDYTKFQDGDTPVTQDDLLADVRRLVQSVNFPSFKELGLDTDDSEGIMLIQYYPKPGMGTKDENLASKPYACYDLETSTWLKHPEPITAQFYGEAFILIMPKAQDIAIQSEAALDELARNTTDWQFWQGMYSKYKKEEYLKEAELSKDKAEQFRDNVKNLFEGVFQGRAKAYSPEGEGNKDERDLIQKLLEVWGIFQKLKHFARAPLPWEDNELPSSPVEMQDDNVKDQKDEKDSNQKNSHWLIVAQLQGLPQSAFGPNPHIQDVARSYMQQTGQDYNPPQTYQRVDPQKAAQIAQAYEQAEHRPNDPDVAQSYQAMANETLNQYQHLLNNGYQFEFYPDGVDPYPNGPRQALEDLQQNKHLYVYPTSAGFGQEDEDSTDHPLLQNSGVQWNGKPVTHNDLFRGVHDVFGHAKEGVGFRADGEDNAWRQHSAMYSAQARPAMTAETRGQNSWVNFGPYGEQNRTADQANTIYADQKATVLPDWVMHDYSKTATYEDNVFYHTTDASYLPQIATKGLQPGDGRNWKGLVVGKAVYLWPNAGLAWQYRVDLQSRGTGQMQNPITLRIENLDRLRLAPDHEAFLDWMQNESYNVDDDPSGEFTKLMQYSPTLREIMETEGMVTDYRDSLKILAELPPEIKAGLAAMMSEQSQPLMYNGPINADNILIAKSRQLTDELYEELRDKFREEYGREPSENEEDEYEEKFDEWFGQQGDWITADDFEHLMEYTHADYDDSSQDAFMFDPMRQQYPEPSGQLNLLTSQFKTADWEDVQEKAQRYYQNGNVQILTNDPTHVVATVYGDVPRKEFGGQTGTYQTEIWKDDPNNPNVISRWNCTCPWGEVSWGRTRQWKKFEGRPCAHATAVQWASQASAQQVPQEQLTIPGMEPQTPGIPQVSPSVVRQPGENLQGFGPTPTPNVPTPGGPNPGIPQPPPPPPPPPVPAPPLPPPPPPPPPPPSHLKTPEEVQTTLDMPGTFTHVIKASMFNSGDMVRTRQPVWGQDHLGNDYIVPKGMEGEVIWSDDEETIAVFSIEISGPLEPFNVRVEDSSDLFYADPKARPFKRRI